MNSDLIREIDLELSSVCNAGCSVCMRRRNGYFTEFSQTYLSLQEIKFIIDEDIIKNLTAFNICGNFGDAMANPDILKIIEWIRSINKTCLINIRTNGGVGRSYLYESLAKLDVKMSFGIDGIDEKNELYRVNVKWEKLYKNLLIFSKNAKSTQIEIQFLLWSETSDQILGIIDLAKSINCGILYLRKPFTQGDYTEVFNMKSESTHFLTELKHESVDVLTKKHWKYEEFDELKDFVIKSNIPTFKLKKSNNQTKPIVINKFNPYNPSPINYTNEEINEIKDIKVQTCFSKNINNIYDLKNSVYNIYITYNKLLMPCCMIPPYVSNHITYSNGFENSYQREILNKIYNIGFNNFSLENRTLREVVNSGVLDSFVYNDLENNNAFGFCKIHCGKHKNNFV